MAVYPGLSEITPNNENDPPKDHQYERPIKKLDIATSTLSDHQYSKLKLSTQHYQPSETCPVIPEDLGYTSVSEYDDTDDEDYVPYPLKGNKVTNEESINNIIEQLPDNLRQHPKFPQLLKEQILQASKKAKTAHRWSVR